ncbi:MAG: AraC family transcriptional regulator [bacterium]|nr:AraC family transcriptional regulator [bacterium]
MITVPHAFLSNSEVKKILVDGLNCVIYKSAQFDNPDNQRYLVTHAFTYVINGALRIFDEQRVLVVQKGEMIFLPKGLYMISDIIPENEEFEAVVFFLEQGLINDFVKLSLSIESSQNTPKPLILSSDDRINVFVESLITMYASGSNNEITKPKLTELLHLLISSESGPQLIKLLHAANQNEKQNIKSFMEQYFDRPLKIEDYANLTGRSVASFHRDFKRVFEEGPKKWLISKRLAKAKEQLEQSSDANISQVASQSGYESASHFIKSFQAKYGVSPKQYMIQNHKNLGIA